MAVFRNYAGLDPGAFKDGSALSTCRNLFRSEAMFLLVSQLTGLELHPWFVQEADEESEEQTQEPEPSATSGEKNTEGD